MVRWPSNGIKPAAKVGQKGRVGSSLTAKASAGSYTSTTRPPSSGGITTNSLERTSTNILAVKLQLFAKRSFARMLTACNSVKLIIGLDLICSYRAIQVEI